MANRLAKIMEPILKKKCQEAYRAGYQEGIHVGYQKKDIAYESEIRCLKIILGVDTIGDVAEVVRCKDCNHRADALDSGNYLCNRKMIGLVRPDDFCSFGERRER